MTIEEQILHELSLVAHDEPSSYPNVREVCAQVGLIHLGYGGQKSTQDLTDGDALTALGERAWQAAVRAAAQVINGYV